MIRKKEAKRKIAENSEKARTKQKASSMCVLFLRFKNINQRTKKMFKALFAQKYQSKLVVLMAVVLVAIVVFAIVGKTELVSDEDAGTQKIQRSIFGLKLNK